MERMFNKDLVIPLIVLVLSYAFLDPFMLLMPTGYIHGVIVLFFLGYIAFSLLVWRESANDEREEVHRAHAGRMAYLAGTGVLVLGIVYQALAAHTVDPWLILTLTVMVFAKYFGLRHAQTTN